MLNSKEDDFGGEGNIDGLDRERETADENIEESTFSVSSREVENSDIRSTQFSTLSQGGRSAGLTERLRDILSNEGDGDLLLQQSDRENNVLQWLQALDLQVMGACRADERSKPLLKLNISSAMAEDPLLAHLSQHFEMPEVGMLARCLCVPLVSIRVGKVTKQGTLLCPTAIRGNLNLALLPSSDLRISFVGDDGSIERLATLGADSDGSVVIEGIPADKSGRSFLVKLQGGQVSYFWCSEQSKLLGLELLAKMKDLLDRKPSLAQLTGISESRLDCFATHLRSHLVGSTISNRQANSVVLPIPLEWDLNAHVSSLSKHSTRHLSGHSGKTQPLYQGCLSPRSSSFKDSASRNSSTRNLPREKFRQRGESHASHSVSAKSPVVSRSTKEASVVTYQPEIKLPGVAEDKSLLPLGILESLGISAFLPSSNPPSLRLPSSKITTSGSSLFSPSYCWCPPCTPTLQYTVQPPGLPSSSSESLPPVSPLLSAARSSSSLVLPNPPLNLGHFPSLDFPAFLPDPIVRAPLPVSSLLTVTNSQQIPTFTPLMCDSIVHIPLLDVCSSGQGYLVSAGPAMSINVPPLHPNLVNPLMPETESLVEKGARETLRLLLSSSQANPALMMDVLPSVLNTTDDKDATFLLGSRGLYSGSRDVGVIASSIAVMGLVSHQYGGGCGDIGKRELLDNQSEKSEDCEGRFCSDDERKESSSSNDDIQERSRRLDAT